MAELAVPTIEPTVLTVVLVAEPIVPSAELAAEPTAEPTADPGHIAVSKVFSKGRTILLALFRHKK